MITRLKYLLVGFYALILLPLAGLATAEEQMELRPVFYVSSENLFRFAVSFGYKVAADDKEGFFNPEIDGPNFILISQKNALIDGAANPEFLTMFSPPDRDTIAKLDAGSDECFIQPIKTSKIDYLLLVLNNSENGPPEIDEKCYLTALAIFRRIDPSTIEAFGEMTVTQIMDKISSTQ